MALIQSIPAGWESFFEREMRRPYWPVLEMKLEVAMQCRRVFPPLDQIWTAFRLCRLGRILVVLLGQDPYPQFGQAHGLAFSVRRDVKSPFSLQRILSALLFDLGADYLNSIEGPRSC